MDAFLRVGSDGGELPIADATGLYRDPDADHQLVAAVGKDTYPLPVADPTVSRRGEQPPIELVPREEWIEVYNHGNENGLTVATSEGTESVHEGFATRVERDATLEVGARARLQLVVEQSDGDSYDITHEGDGDVVVGDKVDARTSVGDENVIKGDIGDGASDDENEGTYCERHDRTFTGSVCPDCVTQRN